jgi:voltage-gated potassium channel Kch
VVVSVSNINGDIDPGARVAPSGWLRVPSMRRFTASPASFRNALRAMVVATVIVTVGGAVAVWLLDRSDFPTFGDALWWSLQTVTTVGYGDTVPQNTAGRVVAAIVLLYSVAFLSILVATITSSFVENARRARRGSEPDIITVLERLGDQDARLAAIEQELRRIVPTAIDEESR